MASGNKQYKLAIEIAGKVASSFNTAMGKAQSGLSKLGSALGTISKVAAAAIGVATTAAVAFAKSAVDAGMEFDQGMAQVAATMGTTVDQIGDLRDFAMEMGAKTAFSATQAAEALNYMALAGYDAQTSMAMLPNVLNLAAAGGIELASASDMITDAQSALGLTLEQTNAMVDQMARASSKTNTSVAQLGEAILTVGGTAQYMAGGTAELNAVLGVLADNGIKGGEGGTHLRNILLKLSSPTKDATALLDKLGVQVFDAEGKMRSFADIFPELNAAMSTMTDQERLDAMSTLFNSRDIASATALLSTTTERWTELGDALGDCAGAAEQMANTQLDNLAGDITLFKSALEGAQITLSDQLTPALREFTQFGTEAVTSLSDAFKEGGLSGAMTALGGVLSDGLNRLVAAAPQAMNAGMQLLGALGQGILDNLPMITDAAIQVILMLVSGIASALPQVAGAAVDVAASLITGIAEALPDLLPEVIGAIVGIFTTLSSRLAGTLPELVPLVVDALLDAIEMLTNPEVLTALFDAAVQIMVGLGKGLIDAVPVLVARIPEIISSFVQAILDSGPVILNAGVQIWKKFQEGVQGVADLFEGKGSLIVSVIAGIGAAFAAWKIVSFASGIVNLVKGFQAFDLASRAAAAGQAILNAVLNANPIVLIVTLVAGLVAAIITLWNTNEEFRNAVIRIWESIKNAFITAWTAIKNAFASVGEFFSGIWSSITGAFSAAASWFNTTVAEPVKAVFRGVWEAVSGFFVSLWNDIVSAYHTVVDPWIEIVRRISQIIYDSVIVPVKNFFQDLWNDIVAIFTPIAQWFSDAFTSAWTAIQNAWVSVTQWFSDIWTGITGAFSAAGSWFSGIFSSAWEGIKSAFSAVGGFFSGIWESIKGAFGSVADWFKGIFTDAWTAVKNVFSTGGEIFVGITDGILGTFKTIVNGIIGGLNKVIAVPFNGINDALGKIKGIEIVGVKPFSWIKTISVPQIPMLAKGGIVDQPTILEAGEAGTEAIVPLSELWTKMQDMIGTALGGISDGISSLREKLDDAATGEDGSSLGSLLRRLIPGVKGEPSGEPVPADGPGYVINYAPHYHFEGGSAPSKDDLTEAEHMSQEEFDRRMAKWLKDKDRKGF